MVRLRTTVKLKPCRWTRDRCHVLRRTKSAYQSTTIAPNSLVHSEIDDWGRGVHGESRELADYDERGGKGEELHGDDHCCCHYVHYTDPQHLDERLQLGSCMDACSRNLANPNLAYQTVPGCVVESRDRGTFCPQRECEC